MRWVDRDKIWRTAWALIPVALLVNTFVAFRSERASLLHDQAQVELASGNMAEAARRFERAAELDPGSALLAYNAGAAYLQVGERELAVRWIEESVRRDGSFRPALRARRQLERDRAATP